MKAFISYSHSDEAALKRLHVHLAMLRREGRLQAWFDREILAGGGIDAEISRNLNESDLYLLIVSPDFLASDYCYDKEMIFALNRHRKGDAQVVPIIIEPCDWKSSPLRELKALPRDGKPVSEWTNQNNAFLDAVTEIRRMLDPNHAALHDHIPAQANVSAPESTRRYRLRRDFDELDKNDFRNEAFSFIRDYFAKSVDEINGIPDIRARFEIFSKNSFGCTLVNKALDRGAAYITVHMKRGGHGIGDLYYAFAENSPEGSANGGFNINNDEFDLFLEARSFGFGQSSGRLSIQSAAETLWSEFLQQAGVEYE